MKMAIVNEQGYVKVKIGKRRYGCRTIYRNFWIGRKQIRFDINFPRRYWSKRIKLKVEVDKNG